MNPQVKIAFWGTPQLTTHYLDALVQAGLKPALIITNPDRPKGRGQEIALTPAKVWGIKNNVRVLQPERLDDAFFQEFLEYKINVSIVVAYGSILPERFIDVPQFGTLNVHYSLLPRYRGASPVEASILAGDKETGVAIQKMVRLLDSGPLIAEKNVSLDEHLTAPELREHLSVIGAQLLMETLPKYLTGLLVPTPQTESQATFCTKIQKEDGFLDLTGNPVYLYRKYRAYYEWPRTFFFYEQNNKKVRLIITRANFVDGVFVIERVLPEGKKEMSFEDFKRGFK